MADYELVNLKEVENSAEKFGMAPDLEARFARAPLGAERSGISYQRLAPNFRMPFGHNHEDQEELYLILSGSGRLKLDEEILDVKAWDVIRIAPETMRAAEAGSDGMELLCYGAGRAGDTEPQPGWWTD